MHNVLRAVVLLAMGTATWTPALHAQGTGSLVLTRRQAIDTALAHNPALTAAKEQIDEAHGAAVQGAAFPDPSFSADVNGQPSITSLGQHTGSDVGLDLALPFPTKFIFQRNIGQAGIDAATFNYRQLRQQIASQTAQAYDGVLVALQHQADLQEAKGLAQSFLEKTKARYAEGSVPKLDVIRAEVDLAQAVNDLLANTRDLSNARSALNRMLGRTLGAGLEPADSLAVPDTLPALDTLLAAARAERPELRGLNSQLRGARAAAHLAGEYWLPDVDLSIQKNVAQGSPNTYTAGIGFSVPLFFWNHQRGEVKEASHYVRELEATYRDLQAQVDEDVRTTYATAATALQQAQYLETQLLPEAREAYRIASTSYGLGGSSALEVLDARRTLLGAESDYAEALGAANDARADLERAIGTTLDSLSGAHHAQ